MEEQYQIVRAFVRDFPGITALEVNDYTGVPMHLILRYINMGLLEVVKDKNSDGVVSERIGILIAKAKEKKRLFEQEKKNKGKVAALDTLSETHEKEKDKFTWLGE
jgi:hypothetical protein